VGKPSDPHACNVPLPHWSHDVATDEFVMTLLAEDEWRARWAAHQARVDAWLAARQARRRTRTAHPVEDFLFTYYNYRPAQLRRWHPGAGVVLAGADPARFGRGYTGTGTGATLDAAGLVEHRRDFLAWVRTLLAETAKRSPHLGCFGLHEWAMVYRTDDVRHAAWPLRLPPDQLAATVEGNRVKCSHFDAFRFFTPAARPLNLLQPTRDTQHELDQPGCLHANMDLYKWAYKLSPLVCSELVADCFALASDIRALDMRASPYDLAALGYPPVRIETPEGRAEYANAQRGFAGRAAPLRKALIDVVEAAVAITDRHDPARSIH
jgi:hypothetical protein